MSSTELSSLTLAPGASASSPLCHIITPVGMLGYGFSEQPIDAELARIVPSGIPTAIIVDSGSTDSGPAKLATGSTTVPRSSYKRDLDKILSLMVKYPSVPLLFSSAGGDGSNDHVDEMHAVMEEIVAERQYSRSFKVLSIYTEVSKDVVKQRLADGKIQGCGPYVPPMDINDIDATPRIVAQAGCEPFLDAMLAVPDFDIVIGGRAYDPAPYVAFAAMQVMKSLKTTASIVKVPVSQLGDGLMGGIFHMGKIMECGGLCATPKSHSAAATVFYDGSFAIRALNKGSRCTPRSVAAHTLYEKSRPDLLYGPGGCLDLTASEYEQLPDGVSVRARGAVFRPITRNGSAYTVKLEAARGIGFRTIFMGALMDPILNAQLDAFLAGVQAYVKSQNKEASAASHAWKLGFHIKKLASHIAGVVDGGVFIVGEALAPSQELANSIASTARIACVHGAYPGQKATSGNFAMGLGGPLEIPTGLCAEFCVYHLMDLDDEEGGAKAVDDVSSDSRAIFRWKKTVVEGNAMVVSEDNTNDVPVVDNTTSKTLADEVAERAAVVTEKAAANTSLALGKNPFGSCQTLGDIASIIRSKNAGPYEITFDILFSSPVVYTLVHDSGLLSESTISRLFQLDRKDIYYCGFFVQALAFKATIPRLRAGQRAASGGYMEEDVHGSQAYLPLMYLRLPDELRTAILATMEE